MPVWRRTDTKATEWPVFVLTAVRNRTKQHTHTHTHVKSGVAKSRAELEHAFPRSPPLNVEQLLGGLREKRRDQTAFLVFTFPTL